MSVSLEDRQLRLSLVLDLLTEVNADDRQVLVNWLRGQPHMVDEQSHYTVVADAQLARITYLIDGPVHAFQPLVGDFLDSVNASGPETDWMNQLVDDLEPDQVGTWLSWSSAGVDGGWHLNGGFDLDDALGRMPPQTALETFRKWQVLTGVDTGWQLRRSLGEPTPMVELDIDLEPLGDDPMPSLNTLFKSLHAQWIGASLVDLFADEHEGPINLRLALTDQGLSQIGVIVPSPTRKLALLLGTLTDQEAHKNLARIEGVLGVEEPAQLVFARVAGRWEVFYSYAL